MPVTSYLGTSSIQQEHPFGLENHELADVLGELRSVTGKDWIIQEKILAKPSGIFSRAASVLRYYLFVRLDCGEYQQINFYDPQNKSPFPRAVDDTVVMAYMIGYLAGRG